VFFQKKGGDREQNESGLPASKCFQVTQAALLGVLVPSGR
jgi:hypothetical protein